MTPHDGFGCFAIKFPSPFTPLLRLHHHRVALPFLCILLLLSFYCPLRFIYFILLDALMVMQRMNDGDQQDASSSSSWGWWRVAETILLIFWCGIIRCAIDIRYWTGGAFSPFNLTTNCSNLIFWWHKQLRCKSLCHTILTRRDGTARGRKSNQLFNLPNCTRGTLSKQIFHNFYIVENFHFSQPI